MGELYRYTGTVIRAIIGQTQRLLQKSLGTHRHVPEIPQGIDQTPVGFSLDGTTDGKKARKARHS
jgi:hypothetical protein